MLSVDIFDGEAPIATVQIEAALDATGEDSGRYAPLVEFRVRKYQLLPAYETLRPIFSRAGEATLSFGGRRGAALTEAERKRAREAMDAGREVERRLTIRESGGEPVEGRVTMFCEVDFSGCRLHAISLALAARYVALSQSA